MDLKTRPSSLPHILKPATPNTTTTPSPVEAPTTQSTKCSCAGVTCPLGYAVSVSESQPEHHRPQTQSAPCPKRQCSGMRNAWLGIPSTLSSPTWPKGLAMCGETPVIRVTKQASIVRCLRCWMKSRTRRRSTYWYEEVCYEGSQCICIWDALLYGSVLAEPVT